MLQLSISLPPNTSHTRENDMITFNIDQEKSRMDLWLAQMNLWLCVDGETTDTALLQLTKDEEFEVHIDSQNEHFNEGDEIYGSYTPVAHEHAWLTLHRESKELPPMFTLIGEEVDAKEIGGDLVSILNHLGKSGWQLIHRESSNTYLVKREKMNHEEL